MYLSASDICYLRDGADALSCAAGLLDTQLAAASRRVASGADCPHIQVVGRAGRWFALNSSQLDLCRLLEREGHCEKVRVDVVDLRQVPEFVRTMMVAPKHGQCRRPCQRPCPRAYVAYVCLYKYVRVFCMLHNDLIFISFLV